mmetsp:Transcript_16558/g.20614  ORF Transcript_16558/g.20614 Transcript_16558/m.20614 type:complete len:212 (-) Transcript_16558:427-1062(-)
MCRRFRRSRRARDSVIRFAFNLVSTLFILVLPQRLASCYVMIVRVARFFVDVNIPFVVTGTGTGGSLSRRGVRTGAGEKEIDAVPFVSLLGIRHGIAIVFVESGRRRSGVTQESAQCGITRGCGPVQRRASELRLDHFSFGAVFYQKLDSLRRERVRITSKMKTRRPVVILRVHVTALSHQHRHELVRAKLTRQHDHGVPVHVPHFEGITG